MIKILLITLFSSIGFNYSISEQVSRSIIIHDSTYLVELTIDLSKIKNEIPNINHIEVFNVNKTKVIEPDIKSFQQIVFKNLESGYYNIIFILNNSDSLIGLINLQRDIVITDLSFIEMNSETEEVIVSEEKLPVELQLEKTVFNIPLFFPDPGVNAIDLLRKLPLITIGVNDVISIRGGTKVLILINGRRSSLFSDLKNLDADLIETVEISTIPSPRYGDNASDGIVNIILKSNKNFEYTGNVSGSLMTREMYSLAGYLNIGIGNFSFNGNSHLGNFNSINQSDYKLTSFFIDTTIQTFISNKSKGNSFNQYHSINILNDVSRNTYIGVDFSFMDYSGNNSIQEFINVSSFPKSNDEDFQRRSEINSKSETLSGSLYINHKSKDKKEELSFNLNYSKDNYNSKSLSNSAPNSYNYKIAEHYDWTMNMRKLYVNFDVMKNFSDKIIVESGYSFNTGVDEYTTLVDTLNYKGEFERIDLLSENNYFKQTIHGFYFTPKLLSKDFLLQTGGRVEFSDFTGTGKEIAFKNNYYNILPIFFISYLINSMDQLSLKYSGYIERPYFQYLNPYLNSSDPLSLYQGNISLKPEYTHSVEFKYNSLIGTGSLSPSIYFKYTDNAINYYSTLLKNNVVYSSYKNHGKIYNYGFDIFYSGSLFNSLLISASLGLAKTNVSENIDFVRSSEFYPNGKLYLSYTFFNVLNTSINFNYEGSRRSSQRLREALSYFDFGISSNFLNNKLRLSLNVHDAFNDNNYRIRSFGEFYQSSFDNYFNNRNVSLRVTYTFGELKFDDRQIKKTKEQPEERFK